MAVLLTYCGTEESNAAANAAIAVASKMRTSLLVLLSEDEQLGPDNRDPEGPLWEMLGATDIPFEIHRSGPGEQISEQVIKLATELECELVVLGLVGKVGGNWTLGPQAQNILLNSPCPVLTATAN
ncbi:universal stress protein [Boudabousia marimammalium]|uniref:UspA domain-containing protein n=1 Tax=Boudabousia marimammalium TaxID=156892 RepID=A0A1Q5PQL8_9ACTO|nr:universal stress protein [Boudabousia marimammalium]OKL49938.1 hypothetical protein BM477_03270 [Boudabousia marimammalium]